MSKEQLTAIFDKYIKKLRITPAWDVKLQFMEDISWKKTGDFKIDCDDQKAILLLNVLNPTQENLEEVIVHELFQKEFSTICSPLLCFSLSFNIVQPIIEFVEGFHFAASTIG